MRSYPGQGTCETIYETEDGGRWRFDSMREPVCDLAATAPRVRIGRIVDGEIVEE